MTNVKETKEDKEETKGTSDFRQLARDLVLLREMVISLSSQVALNNQNALVRHDELTRPLGQVEQNLHRLEERINEQEDALATAMHKINELVGAVKQRRQ